MLQIITSYNYIIHSLNYGWQDYTIKYEDLDILKIDKDFINEYIQEFDPFDLDVLEYRLLYFNKNIKDMIKTKDLTCEIEVAVIDTNRADLEIGYANNFYTGCTTGFDEDILKGLVYKTYLISCKFNTIDEYYGFAIPDFIPYTYCGAMRISSNYPKLEIGKQIDFRFNDELITGAITEIIQPTKKSPFISYSVISINLNKDNTYDIFDGENTIYNDDIIKVY